MNSKSRRTLFVPMIPEQVHFHDLTSHESGELGEILATELTRRMLKKEISHFVPGTVPADVRIEDGIPEEFVVNDETLQIKNDRPIMSDPDLLLGTGWSPDAKFKIEIPINPGGPSRADRKIVKVIYLETKTGIHSRVEDNQKYVMQFVNDNRDLKVAGTNNWEVIVCRIQPDKESRKMVVKFSRYSDDGKLTEFRRYEYSDFPRTKSIQDFSGDAKFSDIFGDFLEKREEACGLSFDVVLYFIIFVFFVIFLDG